MMKVYDIFRAMKIDKPMKVAQDSTTQFLCYMKSKFYYSRLPQVPLGHLEKQIRVLVVSNISGIGNCISSTPLVQAVRIACPNSHITFMSVGGDLFDNWHLPDEIIKDKIPAENLRFDYTLIPHWGDSIHPSWIYAQRFGKVISHKIACNKWYYKPERLYNLDVAKKLGYHGGPLPEYVGIKPTDLLPEGEFITIMPCSNAGDEWDGKRWDKYARLINRLTTEMPRYKICIIGMSSDTFDGRYEQSNVVDLRGKISLAQTAYVLKRSILAVGNDCGPAHISDAVGTHTIWLFGMSCYVKNHPVNKYRILRPNLECSPCEYTARQKICKTHDCIKSITTDAVMAAIADFLNERK